MWATQAGWVVGWGWGKLTGLGSQALGSWGHGGAVSTSKGWYHWQLARPHPSQLSGALLFDVCGGRGAEPTGLPCPLPTHTGSSVLPRSVQLSCLGVVGHSRSDSRLLRCAQNPGKKSPNLGQ